ncbi:hypothetical protein R1sor_011997 [Riccia sorocarpa]|uniref:Xyloglucan endotransglucosylase/hydrolase n=1 Tax=Riccia sorocarpa TaxID=122646 RepID=A0ABD3I3U0_9MARC
MGSKMKLALAVLCFASLYVSVAQADGGNFWDSFYCNFGDWMVRYPGDEQTSGKVVELGLDNSTGSGFRSKYPYLYGSLGMKMKLAAGNSAGVVTSFYLRSRYVNWCELDFEFLGNWTHEPVLLQTNVFSEGIGNREQRITLWFDPSEEYHYYGIVWNEKLIKFLIDDTVIRVFYNSVDLGIPYLDYQPMHVYSSLWEADDWATCGGKRKVDWAAAPFTASYKDFVTDACVVHPDYPNLDTCYDMLYTADYGNYTNTHLSEKEINDLKTVQYNYLTYDYCTDVTRYNVTPPECARNWPQYYSGQ